MSAHARGVDLRSKHDAGARVGMVTLPIGVALLMVPESAGRLLGPGDHAMWMRIIGALDVALVPGLIFGRHRWQWLTARAGLNVVIAGYCLSVVQRERSIGAVVGAGAMVAATVADARTIGGLRRTDGRPETSARARPRL